MEKLLLNVDVTGVLASFCDADSLAGLMCTCKLARDALREEDAAWLEFLRDLHGDIRLPRKRVHFPRDAHRLFSRRAVVFRTRGDVSSATCVLDVARLGEPARVLPVAVASTGGDSSPVRHHTRSRGESMDVPRHTVDPAVAMGALRFVAVTRGGTAVGLSDQGHLACWPSLSLGDLRSPAVRQSVTSSSERQTWRQQLQESRSRGWHLHLPSVQLAPALIQPSSHHLPSSSLFVAGGRLATPHPMESVPIPAGSPSLQSDIFSAVLGELGRREAHQKYTKEGESKLVYFKVRETLQHRDSGGSSSDEDEVGRSMWGGGGEEEEVDVLEGGSSRERRLLEGKSSSVGSGSGSVTGTEESDDGGGSVSREEEEEEEEEDFFLAEDGGGKDGRERRRKSTKKKKSKKKREGRGRDLWPEKDVQRADERRKRRERRQKSKQKSEEKRGEEQNILSGGGGGGGGGLSSQNILSGGGQRDGGDLPPQTILGGGGSVPPPKTIDSSSEPPPSDVPPADLLAAALGGGGLVVTGSGRSHAGSDLSTASSATVGSSASSSRGSASGVSAGTRLRQDVWCVAAWTTESNAPFAADDPRPTVPAMTVATMGNTLLTRCALACADGSVCVLFPEKLDAAGFPVPSLSSAPELIPDRCLRPDNMARWFTDPEQESASSSSSSKHPPSTDTIPETSERCTTPPRRRDLQADLKLARAKEAARTAEETTRRMLYARWASAQTGHPPHRLVEGGPSSTSSLAGSTQNPSSSSSFLGVTPKKQSTTPQKLSTTPQKQSTTPQKPLHSDDPPSSPSLPPSKPSPAISSHSTSSSPVRTSHDRLAEQRHAAVGNADPWLTRPGVWLDLPSETRGSKVRIAKFTRMSTAPETTNTTETPADVFRRYSTKQPSLGGEAPPPSKYCSSGEGPPTASKYSSSGEGPPTTSKYSSSGEGPPTATKYPSSGGAAPPSNYSDLPASKFPSSDVLLVARGRLVSVFVVNGPADDPGVVGSEVVPAGVFSGHVDPVTALAVDEWDEGAGFVLSGDSGGHVHLWGLWSSSTAMASASVTQPVSALAVAQDRNVLAVVGGKHGQVTIFQKDQFRPKLVPISEFPSPHSSVRIAAFGPKHGIPLNDTTLFPGRLAVTAGATGSVSLWRFQYRPLHHRSKSEDNPKSTTHQSPSPTGMPGPGALAAVTSRRHRGPPQSIFSGGSAPPPPTPQSIFSGGSAPPPPTPQSIFSGSSAAPPPLPPPPKSIPSFPPSARYSSDFEGVSRSKSSSSSVFGAAPSMKSLQESEPPSKSLFGGSPSLSKYGSGGPPPSSTHETRVVVTRCSCRGHDALVTAVIVGRDVVTTGSLDGTVRMWDTGGNGRAARTIASHRLYPHTGVSSLASVLGSSKIAVGTTDGRMVILLPPLSPSKPLHPAPAGGNVRHWPIGQLLTSAIPVTLLQKSHSKKPPSPSPPTTTNQTSTSPPLRPKKAPEFFHVDQILLHAKPRTSNAKSTPPISSRKTNVGPLKIPKPQLRKKHRKKAEKLPNE